MTTENLDYKRFLQRLQNYRNAISFLGEAIQTPSPQRIKEAAIVKAYEMAFELAWKTLKDFLEYGGFSNANSPREIIKEAFKQGYIEDGALWIKMLDERNELSHVYSEEKSRASALAITNQYFPPLQALLQFFQSK